MSSRLMQRKFSEPNTYIDGLPSRDCQEELYDDVEMSELMAAVSTWMGHRLTSPSPARPLSRGSDCPQDKQFPVTYRIVFCARGRV